MYATKMKIEVNISVSMLCIAHCCLQASNVKITKSNVLKWLSHEIGEFGFTRLDNLGVSEFVPGGEYCWGDADKWVYKTFKI